MENFYQLKVETCMEKVGSIKDGLSEKEAQQRLLKNGENVIVESKKKNYFLMFLKQFLNLMILVLIVAGILSVIFAILEQSVSEAVDAGIIFFIVLLNGTIGFIQEFKAEKSVQNLKKLSALQSKVFRDGEIKKVESKNLVVGDVVFLEAGDIVPADLRIIESVHLSCDESSLTGESNSILKKSDEINSQVTLADQTNMAFRGTNVTAGRGLGLVVATGMETEIGKIAKMIQNGGASEQTPIQINLKRLGIFLTFAAFVVAIIMFVLEILNSHSSVIYAFMTAVAVAVAAIPESLPAVVTIIMAIGVSKLAKRGAIVKNLNSVETLGCCEVICSDKTGTLTENKMTVEKIYDNKKVYIKSIRKINTQLDFSLKVMALCNSCVVQTKNAFGDPTEVALCEFAIQNGYNKYDLVQSFKQIDEIPFDSNRKLMTSIFENEGKVISLTKGGLDEVLNKCSFILEGKKEVKLSQKRRERILEIGESFAKSALRVLAFAYGKGKEENLVFVGIVGMIDPPRKEAFEAVENCFRAKMIPIMITGDHKDTAFEIAKQLKIATSLKEVLLGSELDKLSDKQFLKIIKKIKVYARVSPQNKVRIVETWKKLGKVVAMTGDGVNDAPCIKAADIGIGMGKGGTDISKDAADIILSDDNFATIVIAVKEGRVIYKNIEKTIKFLLSANGAEMLSILLITILFPNFVFLLPVHILFINLITDSLPSIALGFEPAEENIMDKPPRESKKHMLSGQNKVFIAVFSIVQAAIIICVYIIGLKFFGELEAMSMAFYTFNIVQFFYILSARTEDFFFKNMFKNKWLWFSILFGVVVLVLIVLTPLNEILHLVDVGIEAWFICLGLSVTILPICELYKFWARKLSKKVEKNKWFCFENCLFYGIISLLMGNNLIAKLENKRRF